MPLLLLPGVGMRIGAVSPGAFNKIILMVCFTLLAVFLFLANALDQGRLKIVKTPLDYFILGFFALYTLAFIFSSAPWFSFFPWLVVLASVSFYFLVVNNIERKGIILSLFVASAALCCLVFLASLFFLRQRLGILNPLGSLSSLAAFSAIGAVLAQTFLLKNPNIQTPRKELSSFSEGAKLLSKIFYFLSLFLFLAVIALINFQVGWLILTAGSLLLIGLSMGRGENLGFKKKWVALPVVLALLGLLLLFMRLPLIYDTRLPVEVSLSQGTSLAIGWQASIKGLFGEGPGNFVSAFSKYRPAIFSQGLLWQLRFRQAGNQWLEVLATLGWPGALALTALIIASCLLVFLQGSLLAVFLCILLASVYLCFSPAWWLLFFALLASTIKKGESKDFTLKKSPYTRSLFSLGFIVGVVFAIFVVSFLGRLYLADYYAKKGDFQQALRYNNRQAEYFLAQADNLLSRALNSARAGGDRAEVSGILGGAINYSKLAFDKYPNNVAVCERRAWIFEQARGLVQGANEWAVKTYKRCLTLEPNNPFFYQQLGVALVRAGDVEAGREALQKAIDLRWQMSVAQYELGRIYYNEDDLARAAAHFIASIRIDPNYSNALYSLALLHERQGREEEALALFRRVLELNPESEDVKEKIRGLEK